MSVELDPFGDVVVALRGLLAGLADDVGTKAPPAPWNGAPAFLRIRVYGGGDDTTTDVTRFDVDTLTDDDVAAGDLAERVRQRILSAPGRQFGDYVFDTASTDARPHEVPWGDNSAITNVTAAYRVSARR